MNLHGLPLAALHRKCSYFIKNARISILKSKMGISLTFYFIGLIRPKNGINGL